MVVARPRLDVASYVRLTELADYIVPFAIRVVADLAVADQLIDGPRPVGDLAARTGSHPEALRRVLRALASRGIFTEVDTGVFALTALAEPLCSDHPMSLRQAYPVLPGDVRAWGRLDHSVRTGEPAFDHAHGADYWSYLEAHPGELAAFNASQQAATRLELRTVLPAYPWHEVAAWVDVGGGNGAFLSGILQRHPHLRGTVLDQPDMAAAATDLLAAAGVGDRAEAVGGSFFERVPPGAGGYILKRILYGWDDAAAVALLRAVREAMTDTSRLVILEPVETPGDGRDVGKTYDLLLFAMAGGRVRTRAAIEALLVEAGLRLERVVETMLLPVIEVRPLPAGETATRRDPAALDTPQSRSLEESR